MKWYYVVIIWHHISDELCQKLHFSITTSSFLHSFLPDDKIDGNIITGVYIEAVTKRICHHHSRVGKSNHKIWHASYWIQMWAMWLCILVCKLSLKTYLKKKPWRKVTTPPAGWMVLGGLGGKSNYKICHACYWILAGWQSGCEKEYCDTRSLRAPSGQRYYYTNITLFVLNHM